MTATALPRRSLQEDPEREPLLSTELADDRLELIA
jgi:hypothetical protein